MVSNITKGKHTVQGDIDVIEGSAYNTIELRLKEKEDVREDAEGGILDRLTPVKSLLRNRHKRCLKKVSYERGVGGRMEKWEVKTTIQKEKVDTVDEQVAYILKEKLKGIQKKLKVWNKECFEDLDSQTKSAKEKIQQLDIKGEESGLFEEELEREAKHNLHRLVRFITAPVARQLLVTSTKVGGEMGPLAMFLVYLLSLSRVKASSNIGVNYGQLGNNLPSPYRSIELLTTMKASRVKLYNVDPEILELLSTTKLKVSIMIPNQEISGMAANQSIADEWVRNNVAPYYPKTMIRFLLVGNEVLSYNSEQGHQMWHDLVPAMRSIKRSLKAHNISGIKIGTPLAMDVLQSTFPPSGGTFRSDIRDSVIAPMLKFLDITNSFFFIDVYPYFPWSQDPYNISLDFALFRGSFAITDPVSGLVYTNLLDQMLDSLIFAMSKLGYPNINLVISETGWPNSGDIEEPAANIFNAATYNRNLIHKMTTKPPIGTPARPGVAIPTFIFSLFDENQKPGPGTERHWGLLHPDGTPIYDIDLTGKESVTDFASLPAPTNNMPYKGKVWCVAANGASKTELEAAMSYSCNEGNMTCDALEPGRECYEPVSIHDHASYVFSSYWAKFRSKGATCYFDGLAQQTAKDPSQANCKYPSKSLWKKEKNRSAEKIISLIKSLNKYNVTISLRKSQERCKINTARNYLHEP
ncbi:hypothetical protein VNO77_04890 [Canavalia gladiata]|uniref:glucan endo-1,3-beta-D-glucosidase n=1 Tax=Canavalia gladiata TaxID=3824 RepID=A0AAN9N312_CANGL